MSPDFASEIAFKAIGFIVNDDTLRDRFLALSGLSPDEIRANLADTDFQASCTWTLYIRQTRFYLNLPGFT